MDALAGYDSEGSESNDSAFTEKPRPFPLKKQVPVVMVQPQADVKYRRESQKAAASSSGSQAGMSDLQQDPEGTWLAGQSSSEAVPRLGEGQTQGQEGLTQVTGQETTEVTFKVTSQRGAEAFQVTISRQEAFVLQITLPSQIKIRVKETSEIPIQITQPS
ncbi:Hypp451 [Branchiostoma lanceolatum]|uniref:Hypp451 protein n=1 Tax=Branchiostoma lanceolatum TaxID=7740 RepID=A0A8J9VM77_BRALA|nr:Hypp451 [Branchiostoma lanceolatum]